MPDEPITHPLLLTELEQFHREVFLPDFERVMAEMCDRMESRMHWNFDAIVSKLDRLQAQAEEMNACVARIDACLERMDQRFRDQNPVSIGRAQAFEG